MHDWVTQEIRPSSHGHFEIQVRCRKCGMILRGFWVPPEKALVCSPPVDLKRAEEVSWEAIPPCAERPHPGRN